jgi:hypothetical protein
VSPDESTPDDENIADDLENDTEPGQDAPGDDHINWRLRRIARSRAEVSRLAGIRDREIDRIEGWLLRAVDPFSRRLAEDVAIVEGLMRARIADNPKAAKKLHLPFGVVAAGPEGMSVELDDDNAFVEWAKERNAELVRWSDPKPAVPAPDKAKIKEALKAGEVLPGARLVMSPRRIVIDTESGE